MHLCVFSVLLCEEVWVLHSCTIRFVVYCITLTGITRAAMLMTIRAVGTLDQDMLG
jgi:hypothetical protein